MAFRAISTSNAQTHCPATVSRDLPQANLNTLLKDLEKPICSWWPGPLPPLVQAEAERADWTLLFNNGPDECIDELLSEHGLRIHFGKSLQEFQADIDQSAIREIQQICRNNLPALEDTYCQIRRFLVDHPVTTYPELQIALGRILQIPFSLIERFYEPSAHFKSLAMKGGAYWLCPYCGGILNWNEEGTIPLCARHSVCGKLRPGYVRPQRFAEQPQLLRLKWSAHRRICIPGIPEIELYLWLCKMQKRHPDIIIEVRLWPEADRYDLLIRFAHQGQIETWAIDVKDYADPAELLRKIQHQDRPHEIFFYNQKPIAWQKAFFVVPQYRLDWDAQYLQRLHLIARQRGYALPSNIAFRSMQQFHEIVKRRLAQLRRMSLSAGGGTSNV